MASASQVTRVGGIRSGKCVTSSFSGALRTAAGSFTTRVLRLDVLQHMGGGDIGHVERAGPGASAPRPCWPGRCVSGVAGVEMGAGLAAHGDGAGEAVTRSAVRPAGWRRPSRKERWRTS